MENSNKKILIVVGVVALIVGLALGNILFGSRVAKLPGTGSDFAGAVGNLLAEDYDPYVQYNQGFNTAKGITNSGALTQSGSATLSGSVTLSGSNTISGATSFTSSVTIGSNGSALTLVKATTCNLALASSTGYAYGSFQLFQGQCGSGVNGFGQITGIQGNDIVNITMSTTTSSAMSSLRIVGMSASSTPGYTHVILLNASSTPITVDSTATSTWNLQVFR